MNRNVKNVILNVKHVYKKLRIVLVVIYNIIFKIMIVLTVQKVVKLVIHRQYVQVV